MKRIIVASLWGVLIGALTFSLEDLAGRAITIPLMLLIFPGVIGSMALVGNVHAFPLTLAALVNALIHTASCWSLLTLIARRGKKQTKNTVNVLD